MSAAITKGYEIKGSLDSLSGLEIYGAVEAVAGIEGELVVPKEIKLPYIITEKDYEDIADIVIKKCVENSFWIDIVDGGDAST